MDGLERMEVTNTSMQGSAGAAAAAEAGGGRAEDDVDDEGDDNIAGESGPAGRTVNRGST